MGAGSYLRLGEFECCLDSSSELKYGATGPFTVVSVGFIPIFPNFRVGTY